MSYQVTDIGIGAEIWSGDSSFLSSDGNIPDLNIADDDFLIEFTIKFIALPSNYGEADHIFSLANPSYDRRSYFLDLIQSGGDFYLRFQLFTDGTAGSVVVCQKSFSDSELETGVWYDFALRRDGSSLYFYLDGAQIGGAETIGSVSAYENTDDPFYIGCYSGTWSLADFQVDEFRISIGTSRSAAWVKATHAGFRDDLITFGEEESLSIPDEITVPVSQEILSLFTLPQLQIAIPTIQESLSLSEGTFYGNFSAVPAIQENLEMSLDGQMQALVPSIQENIQLSALAIHLQLQISLPNIHEVLSLNLRPQISIEIPYMQEILYFDTSPQLQIQLPMAVLSELFSMPTIWDGDAWKKWIDINNDKITKLYYCVLTGDPDGMSDLEIPMSSWQARRKSGDPTFLSVVTPGIDLVGDIADRENGSIDIYLAYLVSGVEYFREVICSVEFESIRVDEGGDNQSTTIQGHKTERFTGKRVAAENVIYYSADNGNTRLRCASAALYLNPGDTVIWGGLEVYADQVVYSVSNAQTTMEIQGGDV